MTDTAAPRQAVTGGRVVVDGVVRRDRTVLVEDGVVRDLVPAGAMPADTAVYDVAGRLVTAGLVEIHQHGAGGHSVNEATDEALAAVLEACARAGVTSVVPTLATGPIDGLVDGIERIAVWMGQNPTRPRVLGAHLEGPYLSWPMRGAQNPACLRYPNDGSVHRLLEHSDTLCIVTVAPELPGAGTLIGDLTGRGIVAALGHSAATVDEVRGAVDAGAAHVIHLWSAQSGVTKRGPWRRPGLLETTLSSDDLTAEVIADGRHLPAELLRIAWRCLGGRLAVVSDAINGAGLPDGTRYRMAGVEYEVADRVGMMLDRTSFGGSVRLLDEHLRVLTAPDVGVPVVDAVAMATEVPARILGLDDRLGRLAAGRAADLAVFDDDFTCHASMVGGRWVHGPWTGDHRATTDGTTDETALSTPPRSA